MEKVKKILEAGPGGTPEGGENIPDDTKPSANPSDPESPATEKTQNENNKQNEIPNKKFIIYAGALSINTIKDLATISPKDNDIYRIILDSESQKTPSGLLKSMKEKASNIIVPNEAANVKRSAMNLFDKLIAFSQNWEKLYKDMGAEVYSNTTSKMVDTMKKIVEELKKSMEAEK